MFSALFSALREIRTKQQDDFVDREKLVFYYGTRVRIKEGYFAGLEGKCVSFAMGDITVSLDNLQSTKHFNPTNLEKIDD